MQAEYVVYQACETGVVGVPADAAGVSSLLPGAEVEMLLLGDPEQLYLRVADELVACETEPRSSWRLREACADNARERLCIVQHVRPAADKLAVTIGVRVLGPRLPLGALQLVVDDRMFEDVQRLDRSIRTNEQALKWLRERLLLPPLRSGQESRLLLGRGAPLDDEGNVEIAFCIIGEGIRADVRRRASEQLPGSGLYEIERVARCPRGREPGIMAVAEAKVTIAAFAEVQEVSAAIDAQLSAVLESESTFLGLWKRYQAIEVEVKLGRALKIGTVPYNSVVDLGGQQYRLIIPKEHASSHKMVPKSEVCILDRFRSPEELGAEFLKTIGKAVYETAERSSGSDEVFAKVQAVEQGGAHLDVKLGKDQPIPEQGYVGASIAGDVKMQDRRNHALQRIAEGKCGMQQLGLIIDEVGPLTSRRPRREKAVTAKLIKRVFTNEAGQSWQPTPRQREAIDAALNTPDIAVIQGPPGTGKTTVMRAIIERIHELNSQDPDRAERFLVTGFQHDAVENAIEKLSIDGLPAMKIGSRKIPGSVQLDDEESRLDQLVEDIVKRSAVLSRGTLKIHEDLQAIEDELLHCALQPKSAASGASIVASVLERFAPKLTKPLQEALATLGRRLSEDAMREPDPELVRLESALRSIRCTPEGFADDGPRNAAIAAVWLRRRGVAQCPELLERAAGWTSPEVPPFLAELEAIRERLLLRHAHRPGMGVLVTVNEELIQLLEEAREQIVRRTADASAADELVLAQFRNELDDREALREAVRHYTAVIAATCQQSVSKEVVRYASAPEDGLEYETVLCDEAARANPLDLLIPMSRAKRRIILVGDHRQLPHIVETDIEERLLADRAQDSGHGTNPPDVTGAFQDALKESMFERIYTVLRDRKGNSESSRGFTVTLNEQFRMHPRLGEFVSEQFYPPEERFTSPRPASDFAHAIAPFEGRYAVWIDVLGEQETKKDGDTSWQRPAEARQIVQHLKPMLDQAIAEGARTTFGVITFYSAQVKAIEQELVRANVMEDQDKDTRRLCAGYAGRLRVGTVDAFQGREFDVVFLSMVRSNRRREAVGMFGHLMSPNRMCVSMSRQKKMLVVVGDSGMLSWPQAAKAVPALVAFAALAKQDASARRESEAS